MEEFAVYFDSPDLTDALKNELKKYFQIRRRSRGGDVISITSINPHVHRVAFKDPEAQQRVLQKREHVLEISGRRLVLTVRETPGPSASFSPTSLTPSKSVDTKPDFTSPQQNQPASFPPSQPTGEEYELQPDPHLLYYLNDSPQSLKVLEESLASVAGSVQLFPEEGRVLVSQLAQPGAACGGSTWKAEVDKVFESYQCHYEVDPRKVKALLQSGRSGLSTDEVKVYIEAGVAVVVGERSRVSAQLAEVGDLCVKRGRSISTKQTSVRRPGEAKLRLLWKEIEQRFPVDFPDVKFTRGDTGQLVLEGTSEEILNASRVISDMENLVLERTDSGVSTHFLAFLKKAYGGPEALADFLGVGDKVEVEFRDTGLRFSSLCVDDLDRIEKALKSEIQEVKVDVPNCSAGLSDLQEELKSKMNEMNQEKYRVQVVFGSNSAVVILGHTKEVEELREVVTQFILDQASIEGQVSLPYPELVNLLPELLQLHKFDHSGVTLHPFTSSSQPMVVLEGPAGKVTWVRNRLGSFLDSIVQDRVTVDLPGAVRYFESPSGRDNISSIARSQKCLAQLLEQTQATKQTLASATSYSLRDGFQVQVCQGDITKMDADVLVNAANEDLEHRGGVAAALSKAGGPQVQKESRAIVKQNGKVPTGECVVTTGGNLNCKKLLHAVGPVGGKWGGRERVLLEKTVQSALDLAEVMEFRSIAMPCISSGLFRVPIPLCADAIVTAVKKFGSQGDRSLNRVILIDKRPKVVKAMQEACDRILQGRNAEIGAPRHQGGATAGASEVGVYVEIIQGTIETQQVDVLVSPMLGHDPLSTRIGNTLKEIVGPQLTPKFHQNAGGATQPGHTVAVSGLPALKAKEVLFINLAAWDKDQNGPPVQVLRRGIGEILASCQTRGCSSVAFPVIGTGVALRFPHSLVSRIMLEEIREFEQKRVSGSSFLVRVVVHPSDKESSKAFQTAQETVRLRGFTNDANPDQASFYRHVSLNTNEVTAMLGEVKLQMVCGNIVHESTDAIVNTTDFSSNNSGVSAAILNAAGPQVQAHLAAVGTPPDHMCTTGPGTLGCREIIHASFFCKPDIIQKNCKKILKQCETKSYRSVAFPAINTGVAGMDSAKACKAMLDGMTSAITEMKPKSLALIRIVILQQTVYDVFRSELKDRFGLTAPRGSNLKEKAKQFIKKLNDKASRTSATSAPQVETFTSSKPPPAVISVIGCSRDAIRTIKAELEGILHKQLLEREVDVHHFSRLEPMELEAIQAKVKVLGISLEHKKRQDVNANQAGAGAGAQDPSEEGGDVYVLKGLKEDVLSVVELVNKAVQKALREDLAGKDEAMMALSVQWSLQDANKCWQEVSLHDNYLLEKAHLNKQVFVDVTAPDGSKVTVNLKAQEATNKLTGIRFKVKRSEEVEALELPTEWEPMNGERFKKVELQPTSQDYQVVAKLFLKTAKAKIHKIERVQNLDLWRAYSVCRQRIFAKNGLLELGEKSLFHGTSLESCRCIERDRFNRSYAGKHAALYGKGVYFALNAEYSVRKYCPADQSGLKRLYMARVLTGRYTLGNSSMSACPARGSDPTDCYDSLVDNQQQPSMFVIFHDDQAYPEYLITFK